MITHFLIGHLLNLITMLLVLFLTVLLGLVLAHLSNNLITNWTQDLFLSLLAYIPGHRFTNLLVGELLHFLGSGLSLDVAFLDRLRVTLLILDRVGMNKEKVLAYLRLLSLTLLLMVMPIQIDKLH